MTVMLIVMALLGLLLGALLNWAADYLPRFAHEKVEGLPAAQARPGLALWALLRGRHPKADAPARRRLWLGAATELGMALFLALVWQREGWSMRFVLLATSCTFFVLIALMDLRYRLVLNVLVFPATLVALVLQAIPPGRHTLMALLGGAVGLLFFLVAALAKPGGMGMGDVKLAGLIGLVVGFPQVLWTLAIGVIAGGVAALLLVVTRRATLKSGIAYAPYLCFGVILTLLYNPLPWLFSLLAAG
jgi:leader peptidase (prepilin peptidase) / N-methyltransferase